MQVYEILLVMLFYFLYAYARPYKTNFVDIIEISLLAYLGVFLMLARIPELQTAENIQLDETSVDSCGKTVPPIGPAWIVLGVLYFLPVTVLLFLLGRWLFYSGVMRLLRYALGKMHIAEPECLHALLHAEWNI